MKISLKRITEPGFLRAIEDLGNTTIDAAAARMVARVLRAVRMELADYEAGRRKAFENHGLPKVENGKRAGIVIPEANREAFAAEMGRLLDVEAELPIAEPIDIGMAPVKPATLVALEGIVR